jgi:hypothetical protein
VNSVDGRRSGTRHPALLELEAALLVSGSQVKAMEVSWMPKRLLLLQQQGASFARR